MFKIKAENQDQICIIRMRALYSAVMENKKNKKTYGNEVHLRNYCSLVSALVSFFNDQQLLDFIFNFPFINYSIKPNVKSILNIIVSKPCNGLKTI